MNNKRKREKKKKKKTAGVLTLPDLTIYYKGTVIKIV
jgi:hypothetical protein